MSLDNPTRPSRQRANGDHPDPHRALPSSAEAELGVLCCIMLNTQDVMLCCQRRNVKSDWFYTPARASIFDHMKAMWLDGEPIDLVTLYQRLSDYEILASCGGETMISTINSYLPTALNVEWYLDTLQEKHTLRRVIAEGSAFASRAYSEQDDVPALLDAFEQRVLGIRIVKRQSRTVDSRTAVSAAMSAIQAQIDREGAIGGFSTGFPELDKLTGGLHRAETFLIAARPSQGKTALMMDIALAVGIEQMLPSLIISAEMSTQQLVQRALCSRASVDLARVRDGVVDGEEQARIAAAGAILDGAKIFYDDSANITIQEITALARRMKQEHNIQALFVDYLQFIGSSTRRREENREREVAEVSKGFKNIAKELDIAVVVCAQINRKFEDRATKGGRPRLSDLRESGSIEQDADFVGFVHREETYVEDLDQKRALAGNAELIVAKQRNGPLGDVPLTFLKQFTRFESRAVTPHEEADAQQALIDDDPREKKRRKNRRGDE